MTETTPQHSTYQLSGIILHVRDDLNILLREYQGQTVFVIEDELNSSYYRMGLAEYTFLTLLDGRTTFATALGKTASIMKEKALSEDQAAGFCQWLVQSGLASTHQSRSISRLEEDAQRGKRKRFKSRFSAATQRLPLFKPDRLISSLTTVFGWLFSGMMGVFWLLLIGSGIVALAVHWNRFCEATSHVISRDNWLWLGLTWLTLKIVHELAHGIACQKFGGHVREAGVMLIVFIPLPYIDVTSSWRFGSKYQRMLVSSAGMMAELALAAMAAIIWSQTEPGLLNQNAYNIVFSAGLITLIFNANPLMRFDGYYILADYLELPNLSMHGQQALKTLARRWGLGLKGTPIEYPEGRKKTILIYGIAAFLWRILICVGLVLMADALLFGAGVILATLMVIVWVVVPTFRLLKFVAVGNRREHPSRTRFCSLLLFVGLAIWGVMSYVPWFGLTSAPFVIDYHARTEVRTSVSGFVDHIFVRTGEVVQKGKPIARLKNIELETSLERIDRDILISTRRADIFLHKKETAAWLVEKETLESLRKRQREVRKQKESLLIVAPRHGMVLNSDLKDLLHTWLDVGDQVATLGPEDEQELLSLVSQFHHDAFLKREGGKVEIHIDGTGLTRIPARLSSVSPKATREFPHPALGAHAGGPLEIRVRMVQEQDSEKQKQEFELLEPHFLARIQIPPTLKRDLAAGQTGRVAFRLQNETVGMYLGRSLYQWWNRRTIAIQRELYKM